MLGSGWKFVHDVLEDSKETTYLGSSKSESSSSDSDTSDSDRPVNIFRFSYIT